jgi:hypothetical protein
MLGAPLRGRLRPSRGRQAKYREDCELRVFHDSPPLRVLLNTPIKERQCSLALSGVRSLRLRLARRPYRSCDELGGKSGTLFERVNVHDQSSFSFVEGLHYRHGGSPLSSRPTRDRLPRTFATSRHLDRPSLAAQLFDRLANCADFHRSRHDHSGLQIVTLFYF